MIIGIIKRFIKRNRAHPMAKNAPKKGKSMRNGNAPSPYTKHKKTPYHYNFKSYHVTRNPYNRADTA